MNAGTDLATLMREIKTPAALTLTEDYGKVAWNVRAIWHEYTGWYDRSRGITELYGVSANTVAPAILKVAGGEAGLVAAAMAFSKEGKPLEALHLLNIVLAAAPSSSAGRQAKRQALQLLLDQTGGNNLWERMSIAAELRELEEDSPDAGER
jgi:alkyl sulfatase BDS1-like metallo-beta-lactamase superfamily hydrolase